MLEIRELRVDDLPAIQATSGGAAWNGGEVKWRRYFDEQLSGLRTALVAVDPPAVVGYGSLVWRSAYHHFLEARVPEINDLVVAEQNRRRGVGTQLIERLEDRARARGCAEVGLGVGLHADYGPAQRLYNHLGYSPDGHGITYRGVAVAGGDPVRVDDDLVLWLVKTLAPVRDAARR
jgi:GNAT superfamily N-acetyltransferase